MKKVLALTLAVMMLASVLAGCSTTLVYDENTKTYDKGAIIDMYLTTEVYNFDPQLSTTDDAMLKIMDLLYDGLTSIDEKGKWQNSLMKDYVIDVDDGEEFIVLVNLNDTRWSDGRTVQASDFVYSWKRILDPDATSEAASLLYDIKNAYAIKTGDATIDDLGVAAVDTYTLQIEFEQKVDIDQFFENCSAIALVPLREDIISRYGTDIWAQKATTIVTNGPFTLREAIYTNSLTLERSSYYYLDQEKEEMLDKYVIPYRLITKYSTGNAEAQLQALNSGSIFYDGEIPMSARAQYKDSAVITDMMATHTYVFNCNNSLFAKPEVRRALSMALDREAIANIVTFAKAASGYIPYKVFDSVSGTSFREVGGNVISTSADEAGAKSLLSGAGVNGGSFTLTVRNNEVDVAIADYVAGVWKNLGFNVTVNAVDASKNPADEDGVLYLDNFQQKYDSGDFDVIAIDMTMLAPDAFSALSQFTVAYSGNGVDMYSENYDLYGHISGYSNADYDALIESAFAEKDRAARATILHQAEAKLMEDMPVIPLVFLQDAYISGDMLSGIKTTYYGTRDLNRVELKDYMTYKAATDTVADSTNAEETAAE